MMVVMRALRQAIDDMGGQSVLARAIGVVPQVVNNWLARGNVPADHCPSIERATKGAVRCEDLRPDIDWAYLRGTSTVNPENTQKIEPEPHIECCSGDPRHGERRRHELRMTNRREDEAA